MCVLVTPSVTSGWLLNSSTSRELPGQSLADQKFIRGVHLVLEMVPVAANGTVPVVSAACHSKSIKSELEGWSKETGATAGVQDGQRRWKKKKKRWMSRN